MPASRPAERPLDAELLRGWPLRHEGADKIERGTVLVIGGSVETPGAAVLAGIAALRMGAGRLQIATAPELADQIAVAVPEARVVGYDDLDVLRPLVAECDAVVVGPGIVGATTTQRFLRLVLGHRGRGTAAVVDAGALPAFAERASDGPHDGIVLTPNRDELTLFGDVDGDGDGDAPSVTDVAVGRGVTVASFGEVAAADGRRWCDAVEADGLGTSGSGDVLAGAIAGAAARSGDPVRAACWALYAHRCAGSRLARHVGPTGYLARELADQLAPVVADIAAGGSGDGDERLGGVTGSSRR